MSTTLVRDVRLVPVGGGRAPDHPVDLRIVDGRVAEVAPGLRAAPDDLVLDAGGRWAIPGLWDAHVHLGQWAQHRARLDVSGSTSAYEVVRRVAEHLTARPRDQRDRWLVATGFRAATWPEAPTVALLDAATGDVPVVVISGDVHSGWLNTAALRRLGVPDRDEPLTEAAWFGLYPRVAQREGGAAQADDRYREALGEAAARGVVGVVDLELARGHAEWPGRVARGLDLLRVRPGVYPRDLDEVLALGLRTGDVLDDRGLVTMGPLKIISDGSLNTRTAWCDQPYADAPAAHPHGVQNHPLPELVDLLGRARAAGLEVALHAIGDAAAAAALDAYAETGARGSVEHAQLLRRADIVRLARLGIRASVQPAHLLDDRDVTAHCWPDRTDRCFPLRSLHDAGVTLALGSDAPVSPLDPWLAMAAAVHRSADDRAPWNPAEALTVVQALAASTDGQGTLAAGSRGDVVLLDADPLAPPAGGLPDTAAVGQHLRAMGVAATLVAGRPTHLAL